MEDPIRVEPIFQSLLGQAYSRVQNPNFTRAAECFREAQKKGHWDIFMMRQWFYVEMHTGYSLAEAEKVCKIVLEAPKIDARYRSEFAAKLGECYHKQAKPFRYTDKNRAIRFLKHSLVQYFESTWLGRDVPGIDRNRQKEWLESVAISLVELIGEDLEPLFSLIEELPSAGHDIDLDAARCLIEPLRVLARIPRPTVTHRLRGLSTRCIGSLQRSARKLARREGIDYVIEKLEALVREIDGSTKA